MHHASFGLVGDADTHSTTVDEDSDAEDTAVDEASHKAREGKAGAVCSGGANAEGTAVASEQESSATSCAPKRQKCDSELAAVVHLLPPLPSLVTLHLTSRRSDYVGWKAAARAWSSGDSAQRAERVQHAEHFSQSLNAILAFSTRLQTLQLSTSQLPDSALHAVGSLAGLPSLTELCLGESTCGATTAGALHWQLRGHTALADVKLSGCRYCFSHSFDAPAIGQFIVSRLDFPLYFSTRGQQSVQASQVLDMLQVEGSRSQGSGGLAEDAASSERGDV